MKKREFLKRDLVNGFYGMKFHEKEAEKLLRGQTLQIKLDLEFYIENSNLVEIDGNRKYFHRLA